MKKLMLGILIVIPLIIVFTVTFVTAIVSAVAYIGVESISLNQKSIEIGLSEELVDLDELLTVVVMPERATDRSYVWTIKDLTCLDEDYQEEREYYLAHKDDEDFHGSEVLPAACLVGGNGGEAESNSTGKLKINAYCSFYAVAQAETHSARCLIYVAGYELDSISLSGTGTMQTGEKQILSYVCKPVDSIVNFTEWSSDDESVAKVDKNGVVTATGEGTARITVKAKRYEDSEYIVSSAFEIAVTSGATLFGNSITVHTQSVSLASLGVADGDVSALSGCTVDSGTVTITADTATISVGGQAIELKKCADNAISIENASVYDCLSGGGYIFPIWDVPVSLKAVYASVLKEGTPDVVTWSSSRPAVATVSEDGRVMGKSAGIAVITAQSGEYSASVSVNVRRKITTVILDITDSSLRVGIARETVFADKKYVSNDRTNYTTENNSLTVEILRPVMEENVNAAEYYSAFDFSVTENGEPTDKAIFENGVLTFDSDKITEDTYITATVKAKYPKFSSEAGIGYATSSFTVKVIDGVAVTRQADIQRAYYAVQDMALEDDVSIVNDGVFNNGYSIVLMLRTSIYGNNHMISSTVAEMGHNQAGARETHTALFGVFDVCDIVLSNVTIRPNEVGEEIKSSSDEDMGTLMGTAISLHRVRVDLGAENDLEIKTRIEYSIIENCRIAVEVQSSELYLEGSIVRNMLEFGIRSISNISTNAQGNPNARFGYVTFKNLVFSNTCGTCFNIGNDGYLTKNGHEQAIAEGKVNRFTQIGFMDVYNWQEMNMLNILPVDEIGEFGPMLNGIVRDTITNSSVCAPFRMMQDGVHYFHFAGLSAGLTEPTVMEVLRMDDKRLKMFTTDDLHEKDDFVQVGNTKIWGYTNTETEIVPGATYAVNQKLFDKLHGIGVQYPEGTPEYEAAHAE